MQQATWYRTLGAVTVLLGLAACAPGPDEDPADTASTLATPSPAATTTTPAPPSATATEHPDHDEPEQLPELAVWDDASRAGAIAHADTVMRAFAQPLASYDAWWAGLAPLLSSTAQEVYSSVDPINIPVSLVTGAGVSVDESTPSLARVEIPTDAGTYTILLSRDDADPTGWVAEKIQPPEQP